MTKRYEFRIEGVTPLLMHFYNFEYDDEENAKGKSEGKAGDDRFPAWTWKKYVYVADKLVVIPTENLLSAFCTAGAKINIGKRQTLKQSSQFLFFDRPFLPLQIPGVKGKTRTVAEEDVKAIEGTFSDHREAVKKLGFRLFAKPVAVNRKRHIRVRPCFDQWGAEGAFETDDENMMDLRTVQSLFALAGRRCGIGDWRMSAPSRPGSYGAFSSEVWEA